LNEEKLTVQQISEITSIPVSSLSARRRKLGLAKKRVPKAATSAPESVPGSLAKQLVKIRVVHGANTRIELDKLAVWVRDHQLKEGDEVKVDGADPEGLIVQRTPLLLGLEEAFRKDPATLATVERFVKEAKAKAKPSEAPAAS
jgi:hypothetical protein